MPPAAHGLDKLVLVLHICLFSCPKSLYYPFHLVIFTLSVDLGFTFPSPEKSFPTFFVIGCGEPKYLSLPKKSSFMVVWLMELFICNFIFICDYLILVHLPPWIITCKNLTHKSRYKHLLNNFLRWTLISIPIYVEENGVKSVQASYPDHTASKQCGWNSNLGQGFSNIITTKLCLRRYFSTAWLKAWVSTVDQHYILLSSY